MSKTLTIKLTNEDESGWVAETVGLKIDGTNEVSGEGDSIPDALHNLAGEIHTQAMWKIEELIKSGEFDHLFAPTATGEGE